VVTAEPAYEAVGTHAGVKYVSRADNSISVIQRRLRGNYQESNLDPINFFDNGFREDQTEARAQWVATGKSNFTGYVARLDRQHEHFPQRDFQAFAGDLDYSWTPTGKLRFNLGARRTVSAFWQQLISSYRTSDVVTLGTTWQATARTELGIRAERAGIDYQGALIPLTGPARRDEVHRARAHVNWAPHRNIVLRAEVERHVQSSNVPAFDFDTTIAGVSASLTF
jgi:hypothetical protein